MDGLMNPMAAQAVTANQPQMDAKQQLANAMNMNRMQQQNPATGGGAYADALAKGLSGYMLGKSMQKPPGMTIDPQGYGMRMPDQLRGGQ